MIPNEELVSTRVTNWTHTNSAARIDVNINVDYKSDPAGVIALMLEAAQENAFCLKDPAPSCYLRMFGDNALQFMLTFWISEVRDGRMKPQSDVMIAILEKFKKAGIGIPCPAAANQVGNV
jgi:small-conductance mechanosensitive channel